MALGASDQLINKIAGSVNHPAQLINKLASAAPPS
jgi:hypothetical protein